MIARLFALGPDALEGLASSYVWPHAAPPPPAPPAPSSPSPAALDEAIAALRWEMREWPSRAVGRALMALEAERAARRESRE